MTYVYVSASSRPSLIVCGLLSSLVSRSLLQIQLYIIVVRFTVFAFDFKLSSRKTKIQMRMVCVVWCGVVRMVCVVWCGVVRRARTRTSTCLATS
jgi:hypothetical protein